MDRVTTINPERVQWCCNEYGITPSTLLSKTAVDNLFSGHGITVKQLEKLARNLNRSMLFFLDANPVNEEQATTPSFRTINRQMPAINPAIKALIARAEKQRDTFIALKEIVQGAALREGPTLPEYTANPKHAAESARDWLNITDQSDFTAIRNAIEAKGIMVIVSNGYQGKWKIPKQSPICGFCLNHPVMPALFVRKEASKGRQAFTMMHELGHLLMRHDSQIDNEDNLVNGKDKERQANLFAENTLLPDASLKAFNIKDIPQDPAEYQCFFKPITKIHCISTQAIIIKLIHKGVLTWEHYHAYKKWGDDLPKKSQTGGVRYRYKEPEAIFGQSYVNHVFDALNSREITLHKASCYLDNIKIDTLQKMDQAHA